MLRTSNRYEAHAHQSARSNDAVTKPLSGLSAFEQATLWTPIQCIGTSGAIP